LMYIGVLAVGIMRGDHRQPLAPRLLFWLRPHN
jgi:hypothetical protein